MASSAVFATDNEAVKHLSPHVVCIDSAGPILTKESGPAVAGDTRSAHPPGVQPPEAHDPRILATLPAKTGASVALAPRKGKQLVIHESSDDFSVEDWPVDAMGAPASSAAHSRRMEETAILTSAPPWPSGRLQHATEILQATISSWQASSESERDLSRLGAMDAAEDAGAVVVPEPVGPIASVPAQFTDVLSHFAQVVELCGGDGGGGTFDAGGAACESMRADAVAPPRDAVASDAPSAATRMASEMPEAAALTPQSELT